MSPSRWNADLDEIVRILVDGMWEGVYADESFDAAYADREMSIIDGIVDIGLAVRVALGKLSESGYSIVKD
ncbi:hypothetical protein [Segniliparus rugosus]|nr:hypothetical protein [Segniliparus rugosus]